jgi:hypothetical protein
LFSSSNSLASAAFLSPAFFNPAVSEQKKTVSVSTADVSGRGKSGAPGLSALAGASFCNCSGVGVVSGGRDRRRAAEMALREGVSAVASRDRRRAARAFFLLALSSAVGGMGGAAAPLPTLLLLQHGDENCTPSLGVSNLAAKV